MCLFPWSERFDCEALIFLDKMIITYFNSKNEILQKSTLIIYLFDENTGTTGCQNKLCLVYSKAHRRTSALLI